MIGILKVLFVQHRKVVQPSAELQAKEAGARFK